MLKTETLAVRADKADIKILYSRFHIAFAKLFLSLFRSSESSRCNSEFRNEVRLEVPKFELNIRTLKYVKLAVLLYILTVLKDRQSSFILL